MPIPESKFEDWKGTGADKGSSDAKTRVEQILRLPRSPAQQSEGEFEVFLQGSYKNTTHTYGSSDVDIVAKLTSAWSYDLSNLNRDDLKRYKMYHSPADYGYDEFSQDVWKWLLKQFDVSALQWDGKAIEIDSDKTGRLNVDVDIVPCVEHRVYTAYPGYEQGVFESGMAFEPRYSTEKIVNYPKLHYRNGCDMHGNYKQTVRIFKNARDYYNECFDTFWTIDAHSYGIECLIYNVPERILKRSSMSDRFDETLEYLETADLTSFEQVSEMEPLFGNNNTQWSVSEAEYLVTRLREMWDDWYEKKHAQLLH